MTELVLDPRAAYRKLMNDRPELFTSDPDGVRLITDPDGQAAIEAAVGAKLAAKGWPAEWATAGVWYQDSYVILLRDAVIFPDGAPGIHHRVIYRTCAGHLSGVAVLPVIDGEVVLVRHYRHAIGGWSWEAPRGATEPGDTLEQTAHAELSEEMGATIADLRYLGHAHSSTALIRGLVSIYLARLSGLGQPATGEGIVEIRRVGLGEFERMIAEGEITDSITISGFAQARLRGFL